MFKENSKLLLVRQIYLYLVSVITIIIFLISTIGLISLGLKELLNVQDYEQIASRGPHECMYQSNGKPVDSVFGNTDDVHLSKIQVDGNTEDCIKNYQERADFNKINNTKRDIVQYLSMLIVAIPVYLFHWRIIRKERKK